MAHNERVDSYSSLPVAEVRGSLLTGCPVPAKTESVSESVDKITGDYLRLQLFYGVHKYEDCPTQTADRRAAEPRAHIRGGEGGVYSVGCERQPRRHRERSGHRSGNFVSPLSYAGRTD